MTQIGQTYLEPAGGPTGVTTSTADNYIESEASVGNTWAVGTVGYGERFHPFGPDGPKGHLGIAVQIEGFDQNFVARSEIFDPSPLTSLSTQDTSGWTSDKYYGVRLDAGLDYRITPDVTLGFSGYVTPAYHTGSANIAQYTSFSGVSQELSYAKSDFTLSGGLGAHVSWRPFANTTLRLSVEHSWLGDVTELHVPENPSEQPASFGGGTVTRDFVKVSFTYRF